MRNKSIFFHHESLSSGHGHCHDDAMQETLALMEYMVKHNAAHAHELEQLASKLCALGNDEAAQQLSLALADYEKGNARLSAVLSTMR